MKTKLEELQDKFKDKLKKIAGKFKIIPSHQYNPAIKQPSRRDRIRAGIQKRNERNSEI